jgi:hypothetical protein
MSSYKFIYSPVEGWVYQSGSDGSNGGWTFYNYTTITGRATALGITIDNGTSVSNTVANNYIGSYSVSPTDPPVLLYQEEVPSSEVRIFIYDDAISDPIVDQEVEIMFYPDGNVSDPVINQEVEVMFYPDGNVTDITNDIDQEVKIWFHPDGNVEDVTASVVSDGFKWWFGMKGKQRYGKGLSRRIRL